MVCDMRHMCRRSHTCSGSGFISEDLRSLHFHSHIMVDVDESITPAFTICLLVFSIYLGGASSKRGRWGIIYIYIWVEDGTHDGTLNLVNLTVCLVSPLAQLWRFGELVEPFVNWRQPQDFPLWKAPLAVGDHVPEYLDQNLIWQVLQAGNGSHLQKFCILWFFFT